VVFRASHNHTLSSAAVPKYRDFGTDSKQWLCELFRQGHSVSSAMHCLKTDLFIKYGDKYYEFAADGHFVPSLSVVCALLSKELCGEYGSTSDSKKFSTLENMLATYNDSMGCKTKFGRNGYNYNGSMCTCHHVPTSFSDKLVNWSWWMQLVAWTSNDIDCICFCH